MHKISIIVNSILAFFLFGCAENLTKANEEQEYFVFFKSTYMKLNGSDSYRTYPWRPEDSEKREEKESENELEEVLVIHSCGLFEVELIGFWLKNLNASIKETEKNIYKSLLSRRRVLQYLPPPLLWA